MTTFQPSPGDTLACDFAPGTPPERFRVIAHPAAPQFAHAAEGSEGTVFQVEHEGSGLRYALKVMKPLRQSPTLPETCRRLRSFAPMPGLRVCERFCLDPATSPRVTAAIPALRFAMVMPWVADPPWLQTVASGQAITADFGLAAARSLAQCLLNLEAFGASHGDLSSGNVLVHASRGEVSLVDVEGLFAPSFPPPQHTVLGTPGYNLVQSAEGVCTPSADRFAAAVLLAEMLGWHDPRVRAASSTRGSYFAPEDVPSPAAPRFALLRTVLAERSPKLAALFGNAWMSGRRGASPTARDWVEALDALGTTARRTLPLEPGSPPAPPAAAYPRTQELQIAPQVPRDARPAAPPPVQATVALTQPPVVPAANPVARPPPSEVPPPDPVAFWRALKPSPRNEDPVVGWSTSGPLTPKRYRDP